MRATIFNAIKLILVFSIITSCVPSRMFDDLKTKNKNCEEERNDLKGENLKLSTANDELTTQVHDLRRDNSYLKKDTAALGKSNRRMTSLYNEVSHSYENLLSNNDKLLAENQSTSRKLILELQQTQEELFKREDSLKQREKIVTDLTLALQKREQRVKELESIIAEKDSLTRALKEKVTKALTGFINDGLTVEHKNGRVYISLEEKLLFASGSTTIDTRGEEALSKLAPILEKETDITVQIEGHTDDVPIKGGPVKDNWDLSVLRATSVVRVLLKNGNIAPIRLTPAGRGEFMPIDPADNAEARKKNRRIEIILTPNYDQLLEALDMK
jgi:chemotaxis protein MotB